MKIFITKIPTSVFIFILSVFGQNAYSHCQIPCGIYDDHARYKSMLEDASTVEKATNQIITLSNDIDSKEKSIPIAQNYNQLVRWVSHQREPCRKNNKYHCQLFFDTTNKTLNKRITSID